MNSRFRNPKWVKKKKKFKIKVISHYTDGTFRCTCCNYPGIEFLSVDHINNDGKKHREILKYDGLSMYEDIVRRKFPSDIQVICFNCNMAKQFFGKGVCPHKISGYLYK